MRATTAIVAFALIETLALLAVVTPVTHVRSLTHHLLLRQAPPLMAGEPFFIVARSLLMVVGLQVAFGFRDLYRWAVIVRPQLVVMRLVEAVTVVLIALPLLYYLMEATDNALGLGGTLIRLQVHPLLVMAGSGTSFLVAYFLRMRWPRFLRRARLAERVAILGHGADVELVTEAVRRQQDPSIQLLGTIDGRDGALGPHLGAPEDVVGVVREHRIDRLVLGDADAVAGARMLAVLQAGARIDDLSAFYERLTGRISVDDLHRPHLFLSSAARVGPLNHILKRAVDVVIAAVALAVTLPIGLLVALAIKLDSRGPVLYRQERVGLDGRRFTLAKFRSMRADAESQSGPVWASSDDDRVTRVGRWLRKTRLDELPQLWCVLTNDMSLVGPRPERPHFVAELEGQIPSYAQRHLVKPGITGWAQINYSYGNSVSDALIKHQFDLYYVKHRSMALDVAILLRTIKVVVLRQGAV